MFTGLLNSPSRTCSAAGTAVCIWLKIVGEESQLESEKSLLKVNAPAGPAKVKAAASAAPAISDEYCPMVPFHPQDFADCPRWRRIHRSIARKLSNRRTQNYLGARRSVGRRAHGTFKPILNVEGTLTLPSLYCSAFPTVSPDNTGSIRYFFVYTVTDRLSILANQTPRFDEWLPQGPAVRGTHSRCVRNATSDG